ncbi:MAG: glycosyltransferase family 2 protein, partial [Planctomycetota bacterium]
IGETLGSILAQTYDEIETIVVDDGSTDRTPEVLREWQERFRRGRGRDLRVFRQDHGGAPAARNLGAAESRGEFVNFFDDDDLMSADKTEAHVAALLRTGSDLVYCAMRMFEKHGGRYWLFGPSAAPPPPEDGNLLRGWLEGWGWVQQSAVYRRRFLNQVGPWDPVLLRGQDADFKLRCVLCSPKVTLCDRGVVFYRVHGKGISGRRHPAATRSLIRSCVLAERHAGRLGSWETVRRSVARHWALLAMRFYWWGPRGGGVYCERQVLRCDPDFRLPRGGPLSRLSYRIGGFRLLCHKSRLVESVMRGLARNLGICLFGTRLVRTLPLG